MKYQSQIVGHGGQNVLLTLDSQEAQIVADCIENVYGLVQTTHEVNDYRISNGLVHVGTSAVYSLVIRMKPVVTRITPAKQGNYYYDSPWAKARYNFCLQLAIRLGVASWDENCRGYEDGPCPEYFDCNKVSKLHYSQIVFWDETHRKQYIGEMGAGGTKDKYYFNRSKKINN